MPHPKYKTPPCSGKMANYSRIKSRCMTAKKRRYQIGPKQEVDNVEASTTPIATLTSSTGPVYLGKRLVDETLYNDKLPDHLQHARQKYQDESSPDRNKRKAGAKLLSSVVEHVELAVPNNDFCYTRSRNEADYQTPEWDPARFNAALLRREQNIKALEEYLLKDSKKRENDILKKTDHIKKEHKQKQQELQSDVPIQRSDLQLTDFDNRVKIAFDRRHASEHVAKEYSELHEDEAKEPRRVLVEKHRKNVCFDQTSIQGFHDYAEDKRKAEMRIREKRNSAAGKALTNFLKDNRGMSQDDVATENSGSDDETNKLLDIRRDSGYVAHEPLEPLLRSSSPLSPDSIPSDDDDNGVDVGTADGLVTQETSNEEPVIYPVPQNDCTPGSSEDSDIDTSAQSGRHEDSDADSIAKLDDASCPREESDADTTIQPGLSHSDSAYFRDGLEADITGKPSSKGKLGVTIRSIRTVLSHNLSFYKITYMNTSQTGFVIEDQTLKALMDEPTGSIHKHTFKEVGPPQDSLVVEIFSERKYSMGTAVIPINSEETKGCSWHYVSLSGNQSNKTRVLVGWSFYHESYMPREFSVKFRCARRNVRTKLV
eukprot:TRINITY_DN22358_c0_g1_i2.p1 TRINITY_DN22358_c0_g1~~TRINITY_DN22358_c0_g1_i2.p1  ORF type:complete len:598 (+),score=92.11 TRINITY_DN22358_c0_g1_i2:207-2000(+)